SWIQRFIWNSQARVKNQVRKSGMLPLEEINAAELKICHLVQKSGFSKVGESVHGISVTSADGLLRVKSKLLHRADSTDFRMPILLPNSHPFVSQLIEFMHQQYGHGGIQFMM